MKYLFVVQGEGRGHFTQALSLKKMLESDGHEVTAVMVGSSTKRTLPEFFSKKINAEIIRFQSPNFLPTPNGKNSILMGSILYNLFLLPVYISSLFTIRRTINEKQVDVVINFYELICGVTYGVFNPQVPMINIAHQYYFMTPEFSYTGKNVFQFKLLNFYSRLTALNAMKILALSFRKEKQMNLGKVSIVPPLLRSEVLNKKIYDGFHIHGYLLNSGYSEELKAWSLKNPDQKLHFFWDKKNAESVTILTPSLMMHTLSDTEFLNYLADSKAFATTAGFESVCEAMYMQKPVLMVPTHIEQECNVIDAMQSGAGVTADTFDLDLLMNFLSEYDKSNEFKYWLQLAESIFLYELTSIEPEPKTILSAF